MYIYKYKYIFMYIRHIVLHVNKYHLRVFCGTSSS